MPEPSRVRRQLGAELQTARSLAGMSQRDLAAHLDMSQSALARVERGERPLSRPAAVDWLTHVGADDAVRDRVLALVDAAHTETRAWRDLYASTGSLQEEARQSNLDARLVCMYEETVIPGLLQTADYARRVLELSDVAERMDRRAALAARLDRQQVLRDEGRTFRFLLAERLLSWEPAAGLIGPQLAQLLAVAELPAVEIGVLPETFADALPWHGFVLRYPADDSPPYVAVELIHGEQRLTDPEDVDTYVRLWDRMWTAAITGPAALDVIRRA